ncbi:hypothetical protein ACJRO7_005783 [Eucalyptus globulus]|uniref:Uncharacterized protein n=1 Tax=Eucalyptus globulus TaxID=34317 RepID=A0ABD3J3A2_EUCGL
MCQPSFPVVGVSRRTRSRQRQVAPPETVAREAGGNEAANEEARGNGGSGGGTANWCLCSPTAHPRSFRCRYHQSNYTWVGRVGFDTRNRVQSDK